MSFEEHIIQPAIIVLLGAKRFHYLKASFYYLKVSSSPTIMSSEGIYFANPAPNINQRKPPSHEKMLISSTSLDQRMP